MEGRVDHHRQLQERLETLVEPICNAHGVQLYDVRLLRGGKEGAVLRVILERPGADAGGGVTLDDCQKVSREISAVLDADEEAVPSASYRLEVSSPGLDRPLIALEHFQRFAGHEARVESRVPIDQRRRFRGRILGGRDGHVQVEEDGGRVINVPHETIRKANLVYKL
jgi:ribosome maturation factor RimP